jgi:hypothetical protein
MRKSEQTDKIVPELINVQMALEAVPKKGENPHFKNSYVELGDALAEAVPKLNQAGIFLSQTVDNNCLLTTLLHTSGQWIESAIPLINKKGDDQGQGGSITYAKRYGLLSILGIPTEDDDGNTASIQDYKKPLSAQTDMTPPKPLPNRAPGADVDFDKALQHHRDKLKESVAPQTGKWADYTLKTGKTKGQTIKSIGIDGAMRYREWLQAKGDLKGASKDDYNALVGFQQDCADSNQAKVFRGNESPPITDYEEPVFDNTENIPF